MKLIVVGLAFCLALASAMTDLEMGDGICSLCVQKGESQECCVGNTHCGSVDGSVECTQTIALRDDGLGAEVEFASQLYQRNTADFCSICCGDDLIDSTCCSGQISCTCTKKLKPSCVD